MDQFAPSWMPRSQRRHINRALGKLFHRNACSICGRAFEHNTSTAAGLDARGGVVLAGSCCSGKVAQIFGMGLFQNTTTGTDKVIADILRRGGDMPITPKLDLANSPWKKNDADWFERNPRRSHRMRLPFPGEAGQRRLDEAQDGYELLILLRQVEPGLRQGAAVYISTDLMPLPDDEATAHGLFEAAMGREAMPADREELGTLIQKYTVQGERGQ